MIRTQVQLTEKQFKALKRMSKREHISMAEAIRRALDRIVNVSRLPDRDEIRQRALAAVGTAHSECKDLSENHDKYLAEIYSE